MGLCVGWKLKLGEQLISGTDHDRLVSWSGSVLVMQGDGTLALFQSAQHIGRSAPIWSTQATALIQESQYICRIEGIQSMHAHA
jgi:hypothetical protein